MTSINTVTVIGSSSPDLLIPITGTATSAFVINALGGADFVIGGDFNDRINGGAGRDTVFGREGDDRVTAGAGNDYVDGGEGADILYGGAGNDVM